MFLILSVLFLILIYFYGTRNHDYWKKKGIKYEKSLPFFGGNLKQFTDKINSSERYTKLYNSYPAEKYVGFFRGNTPAILLRDPELIKGVLLTDFLSFHNRGVNPVQELSAEPLLKGIFFVEGDAWKLLRQKLTPGFSITKCKSMFPLLMQRAERVEKILDNVAKDGTELDIIELLARYITDFIGVCGFGIDTESYEEMSDLRKLGKRMVTKTTRDSIVLLLKYTAPEIFKRLYIFDHEIEQKIMTICKQIMSHRNYKPSGKNDFIDFILELRQNNRIVGQSIDIYNADGSAAEVEIELDDVSLISQVFSFFVAGFETSSSSSSFLLNQLAFHPKEQIRCQQEIDEVLARHNGELCWDAIKDLKYLEMCLKESMRILPSPGYILRRSTTDYTFPGTTLTIEKGTPVVISMQSLHLDKQYFEHPNIFNPERFNQENIGNIRKCTYLPFGAGPRACIGGRMGMMIALVCVATVLSKFDVRPTHKSRRVPLVDPKSTMVQNVVGGLYLAFKRRHLG